MHGIAGMGKSELLAAFADRARESGTTVLALDCRTIEPTERGFLGAVGFDDVDSLAKGLAHPAVLALDHYEVFRLMDTWLRQVLVPALPDGVSLVMSGRERPVAGWFALEGFQTLPLGPLEDADAIALLEHGGVPASEAPRLNRIARGHPLALTLATAGVSERPELALEDAALSRVVEELSRLYLEDVDDELRRALEAASVVRRVTESVLAAMLEEDDAGKPLRRLLDLPIVEASRDGLVVHEAVRDRSPPSSAARIRIATAPTAARPGARSAPRRGRREPPSSGATPPTCST